MGGGEVAHTLLLGHDTLNGAAYPGWLGSMKAIRQQDHLPRPASGPGKMRYSMSGSKLAIVGAGSVGTSLRTPPSSAVQPLTSPCSTSTLPRPKPQVLDLAHGTQFAAASASVTGGGDIAVTEGADVGVTTAGADTGIPFVNAAS